MAKVKVYRFRTYDAVKDDGFVSTRMATREAIESSKTLELIPDTEVEIDSSALLQAHGPEGTSAQSTKKGGHDRAIKGVKGSVKAARLRFIAPDDFPL